MHSNDFADLPEKIDQAVSTKASLLEKSTPELAQKFAAVSHDISAKAKFIGSMTQAEISFASNKFSSEVTQQEEIFGQVNKATAVLNATSELTSLGLATEGLATSLFTVKSAVRRRCPPGIPHRNLLEDRQGGESARQDPGRPGGEGRAEDARHRRRRRRLHEDPAVCR